MKKLVIMILIVISSVWYYKRTNVTVDVSFPVEMAFTYSNKLSIEKPPIQKEVKHKYSEKYSDYEITPLATFQLQARVLSSKTYRVDRQADLSPVDLALGWGMMSKDNVLGEIDISQSNRFYYWKAQQLPVPKNIIETSSANMHMIPANEVVRDALFDAKTGDEIQFKGFLVSIFADDGWSWDSSMTRDDTGNGACEVILVDDFRIM